MKGSDEEKENLLAEDHLVVRDGIKLLLDNQDNLEVVADVCCGREILDLLATGAEADILITDLIWLMAVFGSLRTYMKRMLGYKQT